MSDSSEKLSLIQRWLQNSRHHLWILFLASFLEATVVPIPLEAILIPYLFAHRDNLWKVATAVTAGCLLGALVGFGIGREFMESLGQWLIDRLPGDSEGDAFRLQLEADGFFAILAAGVSPVPFQLAMLTAGAVHYPLSLFLLATLIARGIRYYGLAWLVHRFGEQAEEIWKNNKWIAAGLALLVIGALYGISRLIGWLAG